MPPIDQFVNHLEFFGYEIKTTEKGNKLASHATLFNLIIQEFNAGYLFSVWLATNDKAKSDHSAIMESINAFNREATVCRSYIDKDLGLWIEAWYPDLYDKAAFGTFVETLTRDHRRMSADAVKLIDYID